MVIMILINHLYDMSLKLSLKKRSEEVEDKTLTYHSNFTKVITEFLRPFQSVIKLILQPRFFSLYWSSEFSSMVLMYREPAID